MTNTLREIIDKHEPLIDVFYALFNSDLKFITAIELRFITFSATFRAVSDNDTMTVKLDELKVTPEESLIEVSSSEVWTTCRNSQIIWGWQLINQQGYDDGVRLEFTTPDNNCIIIREFIVVASAIQIFSSVSKELII